MNGVFTQSVVALNRLASTYGSTPPLIDFSGASPLDLFEQPARFSLRQKISERVRGCQHEAHLATFCAGRGEASATPKWAFIAVALGQ
jgi:hypothetical protein